MTDRPTPPDFDWLALKDENVEPAIRGNIVMLNMATSSEPLDLNHIQHLLSRLQDGIDRAWKTKEHGRHEL